MQSTHRDKILFSMDAKSLAIVSRALLMMQILLIVILMFSHKMKVYVFYFYLDLIGVIPHIFCLHLFQGYINEDRSVRRACLPIACGILIVLTGAFFFQSMCMIIKYKSLTDMSDGKNGLAADPYQKNKPEVKKSKSGYSYGQDKYVEKPSYDVVDDDEDDGFGMMSFYMFVQVVLFIFWVITYLAFNQYVQDNLPMDQRQRPTSIKLFKKLPRVNQQQSETVTRRVINQVNARREERKVAQEQSDYDRILSQTASSDPIDDEEFARNLDKQLNNNEYALNQSAEEDVEPDTPADRMRKARLDAMNRQRGVELGQINN